MEGLAGRAAVEIVLGVHDLGCYQDIEDAYGTEKKMIRKNAIHGFSSFNNSYIGNRSDQYKADSEREISDELQRLYEETKKLLIQNRAFLDALSDELMKHDYLTVKDIAKIRNETGIVVKY